MNGYRGVDAHAHVFHRRLKMDLARRYTPVTDASLSAYLEVLNQLGITKGILVQPSFLGFDNAFLLECITKSDGRLRGVAVVSPDVSSDTLNNLMAREVVGIRLNLIGTEIPDFQTPKWRSYLKRIADAGLHLEVQCRGHESRDILRTILDILPHVVLDHFGLPINGDSDDQTIRQVLEFGSTRQVFVKLSAPYRFLPDNANLEPLLTVYLEAFGPKNLLWGSDWPHTQFESRGDVSTVLTALGQLLGRETPEYAMVTSGTAEALYRFPPEAH